MVYLDFTSALYYLDMWGLTDLVLPFLLIFTILFAILSQTKIFDDRRYNAIISVAVALLVVIPHVTGGYPGDFDVVEVINNFLPNALIVLVSIFIFLVLLSVVSEKRKISESPIVGIASIIAVIALVLVFLAAVTEGMPGWVNELLDPTTQSLIIMLLIAGLIIWFITRPEKEEGASSGVENLQKWLGDFFGK